MRTPESDIQQTDISRVASLGQSSGESARSMSQPSPLTSEYQVEILRELNNAFAAVLMNAQVLDGKLPSYSRSKRYIHEIERSAQRGGALLKRLLERLPAETACETETGFGKVPPVAERTQAMANQGSAATADGAHNFAPSELAHSAPVFASPDAHRRV